VNDGGLRLSVSVSPTTQIRYVLDLLTYYRAACFLGFEQARNFGVKRKGPLAKTVRLGLRFKDLGTGHRSRRERDDASIKRVGK